MGQAAHNRSLVRGEHQEVIGVKERLDRDLMTHEGKVVLAGQIDTVIAHLTKLKSELSKKGYYDISVAPAKKDQRRLELWGIREENLEEREARVKRLEVLRQRRFKRQKERFQAIHSEYQHLAKFFGEIQDVSDTAEEIGTGETIKLLSQAKMS